MRMRELKPYQTRHGLQTALDNGGRFYNFFSKSQDDIVTRGELAKAAGVFSASTQAFLFLEMMQQELAAEERQSVLQLLESGLREDYQRQRPITLLPSKVETEGVAGRSVIVAGYPKFVENKTEFSGFIMVPISTGKVTTFTMIPIFDRFDVYEVFDDRRMRKPQTVVATVRGQKLEHDGPVRFGGVLRNLKFKDKTKKSHQFFLETVFYTRL
jgi:hypothetical protein